MKTVLIITALAVVYLVAPAGPALAQYSALVNPPACKMDRCLRNCVRNRLIKNCHLRCRRCT